MPPEFSFRLNGTVVPMIFINRERVGGKLTGRRHVAVWIDGIGRFTLDHYRRTPAPADGSAFLAVGQAV